MTVITAAMVKELRDRTGAGITACKKALEETGGDAEAALDILRKAGEAKAIKRADKTAKEGVIAVAISPDNKAAFMAEVNSETDFVARGSAFLAFAQKIAEQGLSEKANNVDSVLALSVNSDNNRSSTLEDERKDLVSRVGENIQVRRVAFLSADKGVIGSYCHGGRIGVLVELDSDKLDIAKDIAMHIAAFNPKAVTVSQIPANYIEKEKEILLAQVKDSGKPAELMEKMVSGRLNKLLKEVTLEGQSFVKDPNISVGDWLKSKEASVLEFKRFEVGEAIEATSQKPEGEAISQQQGSY